MPAPLSIDLRKRIAEGLELGLSHQEIADDLDICRSTVTKLSKHIKQHGHFYPIKPTGLPPTLDEGDLKTVGRIIQENPDGTIELFADLIAEATGKKRLSKSTVHRIIVDQGFSFKKKSKLASERERPDVKKKTENYLQALEEGLEDGSIDPDDLVFIDESGTKTCETNSYAWSKKGQRAFSHEPKNKGNHITIVGAIALTGVLAAMCCECTFGGDSFETFLEYYLLPELRPGQIVIMDNVPFHKTEKVREIISRANARVVFLPPYHPELNPIENMWSKFKASLKMFIEKGMTFYSAVKDSLKKITSNDCEGWFSHCGYIL